MNKVRHLALITTVALLGQSSLFAQDAYQLNERGEMIRPTDYRTWVFVGAPITPNDLNDGKAAFPEIHNVYIDPTSYAEYKATGKFREGTVLIKELVSLGTKTAESGNGYFSGEFLGLEALVKSKNNFAKEPGNWSFFSFTNPKTGVLKANAAAMSTGACNSCHGATGADDYVFTQYYPVLRAAKGVGRTVIPENSAIRAVAKN